MATVKYNKRRAVGRRAGKEADMQFPSVGCIKVKGPLGHDSGPVPTDTC